MLLTSTAVFFLLSPFAGPVAADHGEPYSTEGKCGSNGQKTLGIVEVATPLATFYVDHRSTLIFFNGGNGTWIYQESNKIKHLQRVAGTKGAPPQNPALIVEDSCTDHAGADPDAEGYSPDKVII